MTTTFARSLCDVTAPWPGVQREVIKHVLLVCRLYEEERFRLLQNVGELLKKDVRVPNWSEVDKMRVLMFF